MRALRALDEIEIQKNESMGINVIRRALEEPFRQIVKNAGLEDSAIIQKLKNMKYSEGFNVETEEYGDMFEMGIIDPTKSLQSSLQMALSLVTKMLT